MFFDSLQHIISSFAESGTTPRIDLSPLWEVLKILIPAVTVWLAARATSRKDQRESELRQQDRLNTSWSDMTAQSREIIAGLQKEISRLQAEISDIKLQAQHERQEAEKLRLECDGLREELHKLETEVRKKKSSTRGNSL